MPAVLLPILHSFFCSFFVCFFFVIRIALIWGCRFWLQMTAKYYDNYHRNKSNLPWRVIPLHWPKRNQLTWREQGSRAEDVFFSGDATMTQTAVSFCSCARVWSQRASTESPSICTFSAHQANHLCLCGGQQMYCPSQNPNEAFDLI